MRRQFAALCLSAIFMAGLSACGQGKPVSGESVAVKSHAVSTESVGTKPHAVSNDATGRIGFDKEKVDLGKVEAAAQVPCFFTIYNGGNAVLHVTEAKSECGCTATRFKGATLKPGAKVKLDILVDTTMKQGPVTKDMVVYSDDPERPIVRLYITMDVKNAHGKMSLKDRTKIFTDETCKRCHVDEGVGQFGKELFEADCAMCHRKQESGILSGPLIESVDYSDAVLSAHAADVIAHGSKNSPAMPGFLVDDGGPLAQEQIDSLVNYLKTAAKNKSAK